MLNLKMVQPKKYYKDLKKVQKTKIFATLQSRSIRNQMMMMTINQPSDKDAKTKTSKHTKKYRQMFGDSYEIGKDYANHAKDITHRDL